jgi:integrase
VEAKQAEGLKSATIQKHVGLLRSAINLSVKLGQFRNANPFTGIGNSDGKDKLERSPFTEADMIYLRSRLGELKPELQLLWIVLATTWMRLSEAFEIKEEDIEGGVRFVTVGTKTPQSRRRVPVPADLEPYLPPTITGPLFTGVSKIMGKDLNRFIRRVGIIDERKVLHSLRHRAASRLRAAKCPPDVRYQLLGHEITTVAEDYGEGFPVPILKEWIDKISW